MLCEMGFNAFKNVSIHFGLHGLRRPRSPKWIDFFFVKFLHVQEYSILELSLVWLTDWFIASVLF